MTHPHTTSPWFQALSRDDRKDLLALLHEVRSTSVANPDLSQSIRRARACDRFCVLLRQLEDDHEAAKSVVQARPINLLDGHGVGDHGSTVGVCPDPFCCPCECTGCKRTWWAAGRPTSRDCPTHKK